jgi:hypothetical protein
MKTLLSTFVWVATATFLWAAEPTEPTLFNLFHTDQMLPIEIAIDFDALEANKNTNEESLAVFSFPQSNGQWKELSAKVRTRGRFRRRTCDYPPLKIDFSKKELKAMGLSPYDDLKLVTHCFDGAAGRDAVLREYLAYRLYNVLSPYSFRAQLVEVTYNDIRSKDRYTAYGILLEDTDELAARSNSVECEDCYGIEEALFLQTNLATHALFQYMIGNADWSIEMNRNIKLMKDTHTAHYWVAPYDFDFSGLVDPSYAVVNSDYGQKAITDRVFLGSTSIAPVLEESMALFSLKKPLLYAEVKQLKGLSRSSAKAVLNYLDSFFEELEHGDLNLYEKEPSSIR